MWVSDHDMYVPAATATASRIEVPSNSSRDYRPDIDGLRTIAVVAVILNHLDRNALPLGYLGVDIFFVISGFVITSSIYYRAEAGFYEFWSGFYARRFKRLFPALAACVLITSILICLVDPRPVASLRTGMSALFGLSNIYLLKQATDYFGTWADINAFTQTWSLGVEEQFYLLFPVLVWVSGFGRTRSSKPFIAVAALAGLSSIIFYIFISTKSPPSSFFLLPARLWELALGVLLFAFVRAPKPVSQFASPVPASLVMAALVLLLFIRTEAEVAATIAVVGLSTLLIASLTPNTHAYRLLTLPIMAYLGDVAP